MHVNYDTIVIPSYIFRHFNLKPCAFNMMYNNFARLSSWWEKSDLMSLILIKTLYIIT